MKAVHAAVLTVCLVSLGFNVYQAAPKGPGSYTPETYTDFGPVVIREKGGLLEVSSIRSTEVFQATQAHTILGIPLGSTVTRIRVPAVFRYQVQLAPEWKIQRRPDALIVVAPTVRPALPVAVDLGRLQQESSGVWSVFTGTAQLARLQASITQELGTKAASRSYIEFQREAARATVSEFVAKWVAGHPRDVNPKATIHVFFADEPISALRRVSPAIVEVPASP